MKLAIAPDTTSKLVQVFIQDSSATDGSGLTGLVYNSASLVAYYLREGAASPTAITLASATVGTFTSGGFKEVDATNMPGVYELGIPNAALAAGANQVIVMLKGATNMAPVLLEIQLSNAPADVLAIGGDANAAEALSRWFEGAEYGTAASGSTSTTIRLALGASTTSDYYRGQMIVIAAGTGVGQARLITASSGVSVVTATVARAWDITPNTTSQYVIIPLASIIALIDSTAQQAIRDAMLLAVSAGTPATDSIDDKLDDLETQIAALGGTTLTITSVVNGNNISVFKGDTWTFTLSGLGDISGYEVLAFVVKTKPAQTDDEAMLYVRSDDNLVKVAGADPGDAANGSLTPGSGEVTVQIAMSETDNTTAGEYTWWLKVFDTTPEPDEGFTLAKGKFQINKAGVASIAP